MPFWSKEVKVLPPIVGMTPELMEGPDTRTCIALDAEKGLWLCHIWKCDYQTYDESQALLRRMAKRIPILRIEKRPGGGIIIVSSEGAAFGIRFLTLERLESGNIYKEDTNGKGIYDVLSLPTRRNFLREGHAEYDLLECLFAPAAAIEEKRGEEIRTAFVATYASS